MAYLSSTSVITIIICFTTIIKAQECIEGSTGRRYLNGQTWQNNCISYQCERGGQTNTVRRGCLKADNSCFYEGEIYSYHCFKYRCEIVNNRAVRREIFAGCSKADGSCYGVGETYKYFCYEYKCALRGAVPRREMAGQACSYFERCISVGESIRHGRRQYRCSSRDDGQLIWTQIQNEAPGCYSDDGSLVPERGTKRNECSVYVCQRFSSSSNSYKFQLQSTGCKDAREECVPVGSTRFNCYIDGRYETDCVCRANNGGEAFLGSSAAGRLRPEGRTAAFLYNEEASSEVSSESRVTIPDKCRAPGTDSPMEVDTVLVFKCAEYICEPGIDTDQPKLRVVGRSCQTSEGRCVRPCQITGEGKCRSSTRMFSCVKDGKRHEKCHCLPEKDDTVSYKVMKNCRDPDGKEVKLGRIHMIDCVTYKCEEEGQLVRVSQGCKTARNRCVRLGAENFACNIEGKRHEKCKCILNVEGNVEYLVDMMKPLSCKTKDGRMVEEGSYVTQNCVEYLCEEGGDLIPTKTECETASGDCVPVGSRSFPCLLNNARAICQCRVDDNGKLLYTEYVKQTGCLTASGKLLREDEKEEIDCAYHVCRREGESFKLMPHSVECRTIDGQCVGVGTRGFSCLIDGSQEDECECSVNAKGQVEYSKMASEVCTSDYGQKVEESGSIRVDCADYKCSRINGELQLNLESIECRSSKDKCLPVGSEDFPCKIENAIYENCKCSLTDKGDLLYVPLSVDGSEGCPASTGDVIKEGDSTIIDCTTYRCVREKNLYRLQPDKIECKTADDQCVSVGSVGFACDVRGMRYDRCRCDISKQGTIIYSALTTECKTLDGIKVKVGDTYTHRCAQYICKEKDNGLMLEISKRECLTDAGDCVPVNTPKFPCQINGILTPYCTCKHDHQTGDMIYYKNGCEFKKQFMLRDERKTHSCIEYECKLRGDEWVVDPLKIECQTADDACVAVGSEDFPCYDNSGQRYDSCRCDLDTNQKVVYTLRQSACPVDHLKDRDVFDTTIKVGESVTSECITYMCKTAENGGLELAVNDVECKTLVGQCKPLDSRGFPCQLGSHCQCQREGDHIKYSLYGCWMGEHHMYPDDLREENCTEYICKQDGERFSVDISQQIGCSGKDGGCYPVGSAAFQCRVNDKTHDNCRCEKNSEGKLGYAVQETIKPETVPTTTEAPTTTEGKPKAQMSDRKAGTEDGQIINCYFPFTYDGYEYKDCIKDEEDNDRPWCPTTPNYPDDKSIGLCYPKTETSTTDGVKCEFPFTYSGVKYYDCYPTWTSRWCATTTDYENDGEYGTCA